MDVLCDREMSRVSRDAMWAAIGIRRLPVLSRRHSVDKNKLFMPYLLY